MTEASNSRDESTSADQSLSQADGDDTLFRYEYQMLCAAQESLLLLDSSLGLESIFCELHEDILVKTIDGEFIGIQVKTKKAGAFRADYPEIVHAISRFIQTERRFPGQFIRYILATNATFERAAKDRSWQDIETLIMEGANLGSGTPAINKWYSLYFKELGFETEAQQVFKKLSLKLQAPLDQAELRLSSHIGSLPGMESYGIPVLKRMATALVNAVRTASMRSLSDQQVEKLPYLPEPQRAYQLAVVEKKRLNAGIVRGVFDEVATISFPKSSFKESTVALSDLAKQFQIQKDEIAHLIKSSLPQGDSKDQQYGAKLDALRELIDAGKSSAALGLLLALRKTIGEEDSNPDTQFRLSTCLGVCYFRAGDIALAKKEFKRALLFRPQSSVALCNLAQVLIREKNPSEARDLTKKAIELKLDEVTCSAHLSALLDLKDYKAIASFGQNNPEIYSWAACLSVLGDLSLREENYEEAYKRFKSAIAFDPGEPNLRAQIAYCMHCMLDRDLKNFNDTYLDEKQRKHVAEILKHLNISVAKSAETENTTTELQSLCSRAFVKMLLDDEDGALEDLTAASRLSPTDSRIFRTRGLILFKQKKWKDAIASLEKAQELGAEAFEVGLAACYSALGDFDKVLEILLPYKQSQSNEKRLIIILDLLASTYRITGCEAEFYGILSNLEETFADDVNAIYIRAKQLDLSGRSDEAIALLVDHLSHLKEESSDRTLLLSKLAECYYFARRYSESVDTFELIKNPLVLDSTFELRITAYTNLGRYGIAHAMAKEYLSSGKESSVVMEIDALIAEYVGDINRAFALNDSLFGKDRSVLKYKIKNIQLLARQQRFDDARREMDNISSNLRLCDSDILRECSITYSYLGLFEPALKLALMALSKNPNNHDIQSFYMSSFLRLDSNNSLVKNPLVCGIGSWVKIRNIVSGIESDYEIVESDHEIDNLNQISCYERLSSQLLQRQVGDIFCLKTSESEKVEYEILEIKSIFSRVFQKVIAEFKTRFPESTEIEFISSQRESRILAALEDREKFCKKLFSAYKIARATVAECAELLNCCRLLFFNSILDYDLPIPASDGSDLTQTTERNDASKCDSLVMDILALVSSARLKLLEPLSRHFEGKIFVPFTVLDELLMAKHHLTNSRRTKLLIKVGSGVALAENSEDTIRAEIELVSDIERFVKEKCVVTFSYFSLDSNRDEIDFERESIGLSTYDAAHIARETGALMYTDDLKCSQYFRQRWGIQLAWSRSLLEILFKRSLISEEKYRQVIYQMALFRYWFLPMSPQDLLYALKTNEFSSNKNVFRVFDSLKDANFDDQLLNNLAEVVKQTWLSTQFEEQRIWLLDLCVKTISDREGKNILSRFKSILEAKLHLMPTALISIQASFKFGSE